ncbi:unnamed protein product [Phytophthora fragariaefolia]|uniref:Unnamed protein product n=1 Tax=Phytophthora fragariaefolia TaxID=1490495 RepID=A0A9W7D782_9STRA|nr:unnamed protein product [Phytophthora fragariaefolia]
MVCLHSYDGQFTERRRSEPGGTRCGISNTLYPGQEKISSTEAATAALYAHYDAARIKSANVRAPPPFWVGPNELRAMAQHLREPILVFDTGEHNNAHIQRYGYKMYRRANGKDHESGYAKPLSDRAAVEYLAECKLLHVLPIFLILRHHEKHFYGVCHGDLFIKWRVEGDSTFAEPFIKSFPWVNNLNQLTETEAAVDMKTIDVLATDPKTKPLLIKRMEMRYRLDVVHSRLGLRLITFASEENDWDTILENEEINSHQAYRVDANVATPQDKRDAGTQQLPTRHSHPAIGAFVTKSYHRILRDSKATPMEQVDRLLKEQIITANREALARWCCLYRAELAIPETKRRNAKISDFRAWLITHPPVLRHLFAFLPYPEHEAKRWHIEDLLEWGSQEVYLEPTGGGPEL